MTTAEKYRQLEKSPSINIARYIFSRLKKNATNSTLGDEIIEIKTGKTPSKQNERFYEDDYFNWFKPDEVGSEKYLFEAKDKLSKFAYENNQATVYEPDTILINAIGDVGRISILKVKASSNQQITGIRLNKKIDIDYAYFYLLANRHFFYVDLFQTTLPIVNQKKINSIPFVYPDIEEQRNIVEGLVEIDKINSVEDLEIIEKLNWNDDYKNACRNFFSVQFNSKNITTELSHQLTLVKKLRQQLLQDAVQGKLVEQNPKDEPASELLKKIKTEKAKLIEEKKLKKEKELPLIKPEEIPFEIPKNWVWCRLGEISDFISGSNFDSTDFGKGIGAKCIKITNAGVGEVIETDDVLPIDFIEKFKSYLVFEDDLILALTRPYIADGLKISKCPASYNLSLLNQRVAVIRANYVCQDYVYQFLRSDYVLKKYKSLFEGKGQQPNLKKEDVTELLIPLPPLFEQNRIVQKLDELMLYCNELEGSIKQSESQNEKLLQQVLREALRKDTVEF
jgi:type I restriction enzyme S subunit